jgi:hypothetical protein
MNSLTLPQLLTGRVTYRYYLAATLACFLGIQALGVTHSLFARQLK